MAETRAKSQQQQQQQQKTTVFSSETIETKRILYLSQSNSFELPPAPVSSSLSSIERVSLTSKTRTSLSEVEDQKLASPTSLDGSGNGRVDLNIKQMNGTNLANNKEGRNQSQAVKSSKSSGSKRQTGQYHQHNHQHYYCYYDSNGDSSSNNNSSNNNNNIASPPPEELASPALKRPTMQTATTEASRPANQSSKQKQQQQQQQGSQSQKSRQNNHNHQKQSQQPKLQQLRQPNSHNHHYYEQQHYGLAGTNSSAANETAASHYDQNILLFATEHDARRPDSQEASSASRQQVRLARAPPTPPTTRPPARPTSPAAGRFVERYSSRGPQVPAGQHAHRYAFHVPAGGARPAGRRPARSQSRYGFVVTPSNQPHQSQGGEERDQSRLAGSSFRSRTIAHIPEMVRLSTEQAEGSGWRRSSQVSSCEDFYERPTSVAYQESPPVVRQLIRSEGDLLRAHVVHLKLDEGADNPFKPGTELSWEADLMVRLMQRGYPVGELPALVEAAKQVAGRRRPSLAEMHIGERARRKDQARRRSSVLDLKDSGDNLRQLWAASLSKTKSMPRLSSSKDDSLDEFITSIEDESRQLLLKKSSETRKQKLNADLSIFDDTNKLIHNKTELEQFQKPTKEANLIIKVNNKQQTLATNGTLKKRNVKSKKKSKGNSLQSSKKTDLISHETRRGSNNTNNNSYNNFDKESARKEKKSFKCCQIQ